MDLLRLVFLVEMLCFGSGGDEHKKAEGSVRRESRRPWKREDERRDR
jgi:hypothetical protein